MAETVIPVFECARCGVAHNSPEKQLPDGWTRQGDWVTCPDCATHRFRCVDQRAGKRQTGRAA